ncbi:MAG TPA: 16S rRNA (cytosine(1402)-N(4))-methyltransferase RsmH [Saprospiraceae bacterium]|nr:16S rRNA (cytosine(1402)-N(4))-methyltransferase RsmH [Saprospiraceae bacterium]
MSEQDAAYRHVPVLLQPAVEHLITDPDGVYVDVTFGGGGHSREILTRLGPKGKLFAFDRDRVVLGHVPEDPRFEMVISDFRYLKKYMDYYKMEKLNGILADLGLSSHHIDEADRGFSIYSDQPLDMRMNTRQSKTAWEVLMNYPEARLESVLKTYGELTNARRMAAQWVQDRNRKPINSCKAFAQWAESFAYGKRVKFLAQVFQALRIEVNGEIDALRELLRQSAALLAPGGRMVVLSYHSLEDRLVKQWFKSGDPENESGQTVPAPFASMYKQALVPDDSEIAFNSRARSAKLRIGIKQ